MDRRAVLTVFLVGIVSLAFELVQVRMLSFFLGNGMDFLAIPVALLGLAIGSMSCHFVYKGPPERLVSAMSAAIGPLVLTVFVAVFLVANYAFPAVHASQTDPWAAALRVAVYGLVFLPPYIAFGALLAAAFARAGDRIGQLYFFDLAGAGLGCALVPLMLTWTDLWPTLLVVLFGAFALVAVDASRKPAVIAVALAVYVAVAALAGFGLLFREHPNPTVLASWALGGYKRQGIDEVEVRWNQIARTSLMKARPDGPFAIVQDNGISNVTLQPWVEGRDRDELMKTARHHALAWHLGRDPRSVLVIFAGAGRDLIALDALANGQASLTGVELNPDVVDFANHPAIAHLRIPQFLAQPGRRLVNQEGRHFLDVDDGTYDLIYVANNGAVAVNRTGHSRKFLDTCEAMSEYLDHLAPGGMMVFVNQPVAEKIPCFRRLFEARGLPDAAGAMFSFGWPELDMLDSLVVVPGGLSDGEARKLRQNVMSWQANLKILWDPLTGDGVDRTKALVTGPIDPASLVTDDRPFTQPIVLSELDVFPSTQALSDPKYVNAWVKVFTVALFALVSGGVAMLAHFVGGADRRVPWAWVAYLLASGIGFMCVEIGLIAKTELFVGNPLYAVALNLALFLVSSAVGAGLQDRLRERTGPAHLVGSAVVGIAWGLLLAKACNTWLIGAPLPIKAVALAITVFPAGAALGSFYPFCVARMVGEGRTAAVPMSYGLATLSSVLGSSFAMTAIIDLGFTRVLVLGGAMYLLAGAIVLARPVGRPA